MFVAALVYPQPPPSGSEGPNLVIFIVPFLIAVAAILAIVPAIFMSFLLCQPSHHRNWGIALTVWYSLESIYLGLGIVVTLSSASAMYGSSMQFSFSWLDLGVAAPFLGVLGGLWAIVWHTESSIGLRRLILGPGGRVLLGGLMILFSVGFLPYFTIFAVPAIALLFIAMLIFFAPQTGRAMGGLAVVVCAFVGLLLRNQIVVLFGYPIGYYYGFGAALTALVAGTLLAGSGGIAALLQGSKKPQIEAQSHMGEREPGEMRACVGLKTLF